MSEKTQKEDRRTRYTRQVIKEAFLKLLEEKEYPKITVTEICRLAEINRGTFYLHYYDTADVLDLSLIHIFFNLHIISPCHFYSIPASITATA